MRNNPLDGDRRLVLPGEIVQSEVTAGCKYPGKLMHFWLAGYSGVRAGFSSGIAVF